MLTIPETDREYIERRVDQMERIEHYDFSKKCGNCGSVLHELARYCERCGEKLECVKTLAEDLLEMFGGTLRMRLRKWQRRMISF